MRWIKRLKISCMNIHQVSVTYLNEQDRFLVRINTREGEEMRLWLTRRLSLGLLPLLVKTSADQMKNQLAHNPVAGSLDEQRRVMLENFQKEAAAHSGDYNTPFQDRAKALPLGKEPLLVTEIAITVLPTGQLQLQLFEKLGDKTRHVQVMMEAQLTQGLMHLLGKAIQKSQWLEVPPEAASFGTDAADTPGLPGEIDKKPRYLN